MTSHLTRLHTHRDRATPASSAASESPGLAPVRLRTIDELTRSWASCAPSTMSARRWRAPRWRETRRTIQKRAFDLERAGGPHSRVLGHAQDQRHEVTALDSLDHCHKPPASMSFTLRAAGSHAFIHLAPPWPAGRARARLSRVEAIGEGPLKYATASATLSSSARSPAHARNDISGSAGSEPSPPPQPAGPE